MSIMRDFIREELIKEIIRLGNEQIETLKLNSRMHGCNPEDLIVKGYIVSTRQELVPLDKLDTLTTQELRDLERILSGHDKPLKPMGKTLAEFYDAVLGEPYTPKDDLIKEIKELAREESIRVFQRFPISKDFIENMRHSRIVGVIVPNRIDIVPMDELHTLTVEELKGVRDSFLYQKSLKSADEATNDFIRSVQEEEANRCFILRGLKKLLKFLGLDHSN